MTILQALPNRKVDIEIRFLDKDGLPVYEAGKDINGLETYLYKIYRLDGTEDKKLREELLSREYENVIPMQKRYVFYVKEG